MTNAADEIRASCRTIVQLLDIQENQQAWYESYEKLWREQFHKEAVRLRELLKDHEEAK